VGAGEEVSLLQWRWGLGPLKKIFDFIIRNVELLCILDSATVIMMPHHSLYFQRRKNYGPGGWGPLNTGGPCAQPIATPLDASHHSMILSN